MLERRFDASGLLGLGIFDRPANRSLWLRLGIDSKPLSDCERLRYARLLEAMGDSQGKRSTTR